MEVAVRMRQAFGTLAAAIGLGLLLAVSTPAAGRENGTFVPYQRLVMILADRKPGDSPSQRIRSAYGDLYSWAPGESQLFRETDSGYSDSLVMSPDGTRVVFLS